MTPMRMWTFESRDAPFVEVFRRSATRAGYDVRIISPAKEPTGFAQLKKHYRHLSVNPEPFELACFRRWFEIAAVVKPEERFVQAESDLIIQTPFSDVTPELRDATAVVGSIGCNDDVMERSINCGFSIWTGRQLKAFCEYAVARYESGIEQLACMHARNIAAGQMRASVSDMTLLYQWVQETGEPFVNSNRVINSQYVDHNISVGSCVGTRFCMAFGRKALRFTRDGIWLATREGVPIRPISLHLGGRYKIMAGDVERHAQLRLALKSLYVHGGRTVRGLLMRMRLSR